MSAPSAAAAAKKIPLRSEIPAEDTWDLALLYSSPEAWEKDFEKYQKRYPEYQRFKGVLGRSAADLKACLEFDRELDLLAEKLGHYASLQTAEDSSNNDYLAREARLQNLLTLAAETASFLTPEIQAIPDPVFGGYLADPILAEWKIKLAKLRRFRPHILSEAEERLLAMASPVFWGSGETFSQLTNVDMRFGVLKDEKGREIELSHGAFSSFLVKRDPELRRTAFEQYYREFEEHKFTLASTLALSVKKDVFMARARHFAGAREASLFSDDVPVSVYDNLIATVRSHLDGLHEYYELRKKALGLKDLHFHDTYVPIVDKVEMTTEFGRACSLVLESLGPLGSGYVDVLRDGFGRRWIDKYETKGKRSGAFSSSSFGHPPYILMNYKEDVFSDVFTLAHEAGHSMHSWFSMREQTYQDHHYPIFLAEVASTFNEELLTEHLLRTHDEPRMRAYILNRQLDDIRATVIRQTMFAEFEKVVHEMEEAGEALTLESFRAAYRKLLEAYHGPELVIDEPLELECLRIPHFYNAFYVYKYATGLSAAVALSKQVLQEGEAARNRYLKFLKSGGSRFPLETLQVAGVDMTEPAPVVAALNLFKQRTRELAELL